MTENLSPTKRALIALQKMQNKLSALEKERNSPIAVVGLGCRFPGGNNPESFWQSLRDRTSAIEEISPGRWQNNINGSLRYGGLVPNLKEFDAQFFRIAPKEAMSLDPQQRLLLEVSWEALENAAIAPSNLQDTPTGVFIGICAIDYWHQLLSRNPEHIDAYLTTGNTHSTAAGRLSYLLGLTGISLAVDTACSSSLVAIHLAVKSLREKECNLAIVGGVNRIIDPKISLNFTAAKMLSPTGKCHSFAQDADGFVRSEGCGVVILKRLDDAVAEQDNILAVIYGSAVNQDGRTSSLTAPKGSAQQKVILQAINNSNIQLEQIDYVEAHGTGTALGDPIEANALGEVFKSVKNPSEPLIIGSVKTNIGHTEAAAGIASLIKVILALQNQEIPASLNFTQPNPQINWQELPLKVARENTPWLLGDKLRMAGVSAFGFSGTNAHVVVGDMGDTGDTEDMGDMVELCLLPLSAKSKVALQGLVVRYQDYLEAHLDTSLRDICFTASIGRSHFNHRLAITTISIQDLQAKLASFQSGDITSGVFIGKTSSQKISAKLVDVNSLERINWNDMAKLYVEGTNIPWKKIYEKHFDFAQKITLPTYPFQRKVYWLDRDC